MTNPLLAAVDLTGDWFDGASVGLLFLRVVIGLTLAAHGWNKFFGGGKISGTAKWFDSMGMKPNGRIHALLAASTEVGAGVLLALGLLTPFAAAGFVGVMLVAAWTVHRPNGFFSVNDGYELNMVLAVVPVGIAMIGPGRYSLDWAIGLDLSFRPWLAVAIAAILGLGSGIGLLVGFWKPELAKQ